MHVIISSIKKKNPDSVNVFASISHLFIYLFTYFSCAYDIYAYGQPVPICIQFIEQKAVFTLINIIIQEQLKDMNMLLFIYTCPPVALSPASLYQLVVNLCKSARQCCMTRM